jgi:hypothetical protein
MPWRRFVRPETIIGTHIDMKTPLALLGVCLAAVMTSVVGCMPSTNAITDTVAEGVIFSVQYEFENGRRGGFTRVNEPKAVPGGNGSWNEDASGRLTRDFLIITRPQLRDLGPEVIPVHRLINVQFGDGGIKKVDSQAVSPK